MSILSGGLIGEGVSDLEEEEAGRYQTDGV